MTQIKPIETLCDGHRFRSRLEARWAMVFKELGIGFSYEPNGYDLGQHGRYLPDFFLPDTYLRLGSKKGVFVEIKPTPEIDSNLFNAFANITKSPIIVFTGAPIISIGVTGCAGVGGEEFCGGGIGDTDMNIVVCQRCQTSRFIFDQGYQLKCECGCICEKNHLIRAVDKASQARFEKGDPYRTVKGK